MTASEFSATVGIVIRTKDRPFFVLRALRSVADQVFQNWRIALVNDGGDAGTLSQQIAAAGLSGTTLDKLTQIDLDPGLGRSAAFNQGVEALTTEFICCLDDDDTWSPEFLAALVTFFRKTAATVPGLGGVFARATALREEVTESETGIDLRIVGEDDLPAAFKRNNFFVDPLAYACYRQDFYPVQWMLRRDAVRAVGGFPEEFDVMEDRAFMNRFLSRFRLALLDRPLAYHHRRSNRSRDTARQVMLNTLDNPSYDWRLFADLARPGLDVADTSPETKALLSLSASLLSELNYETSAIWQKIDGEMRGVQARIDTLKAEILAALPQMGAARAGDAPPIPEPAPSPDARLAIPPEKLAYDLWQHYPDRDHAQHVAPGTRFAARLQLSHAGNPQGLLLHVAPALRKLQLQIPQTSDWCAVELSLEHLALPGAGLRCHLHLDAPEGYLFETALTHTDPAHEDGARHMIDAFQVHACHAGRDLVVTREIGADWLARAISPKLSVILPRSAQNFRFVCKSIIVEHHASV